MNCSYCELPIIDGERTRTLGDKVMHTEHRCRELMRNELGALRQKDGQSAGRIAELSGELDQLRTSASQLRVMNNELRERIDALSADKARLSAHIDELQQPTVAQSEPAAIIETVSASAQ